MNPKLLLRIAAIIMFLHAIGHTTGIYTWKKETSHVPRELITQMTEQKFSFMGATATMGAFYDGMGYASSFAMLMVVCILWIISGVDRKYAPFAVKILFPVSLFLLFLGIDELVYFFPMAAAFSFAATLLIFVTISKINKTPA